MSRTYRNSRGYPRGSIAWIRQVTRSSTHSGWTSVADIVILKAARAHAAYEGRTTITDRDIALAAELALPHRIKHGPFHQSEITPEQLQERIEQLQGSSGAGEPAELAEKEPDAESIKKKS